MTLPTRPELKGTFGMVSATHWLAAQAGMSMLERGGNAFDAAVAAGFVLQVVEPHLNGLGGEVPIILWDASSQAAEVICGQGIAPRAATIDCMHDFGIEEVPGSGLLAACVPGAFGGWLALLRDHGTLRLRDVLELAIGYADAGYPVVSGISGVVATVEDLFRRHWPASASLYLRQGVPAAGTLFKNRDLARTYLRLLHEGEQVSDRDGQIEAARRAFYSGFVSEAIERHCRQDFMDSTGAAHAGLLMADDLAAWTASHEDPVTVKYAGWTVAKCGPWSQGPVFLQQLTLLDGFGIGDAGFLSTEHIHLVVESAKLAFADREAWYADPDFAEVPLQDLLSDEYAINRRALVGQTASLEMRPGRPRGLRPHLPQRGTQRVIGGHWTGTGAQALGEVRGDTVHVAVADRHGNLVACTPSGGWLQSSPVIDGLGFCLGTRAQMFNLDPAHPNRLEGLKRPRTTLSPSLAFKDGEPRLAFGTPGGDQQDQWSLEFFLAHAIFGLDLQRAIDAPMFHSSHFPSSFAPHEAFPGQLHIESRLDAKVTEGLTGRGHRVVVEDAWSLGRLCAVGRDSATGLLAAAADPRKAQGYAVGR